MSTKVFGCVLLITLLFSMVTFLFPQIDLTTSELFYQPDHGFLFAYTQNKHFFRFFRDIMVYFTYAFVAVLTIMLLIGLFFKKINMPFSRKECLFLLLCFAAAPTLLVNNVFKNHWGRARPAQIQQFGGHKTFTPAWVISSQCEKNCSFTSGETANIFCYLALIFVVRYKKLTASIVLILGALMVIARIGEGGHFLSDTVLSGLIDYLIIWLIYQSVEKIDHYFELGESHVSHC